MQMFSAMSCSWNLRLQMLAWSTSFSFEDADGAMDTAVEDTSILLSRHLCCPMQDVEGLPWTSRTYLRVAYGDASYTYIAWQSCDLMVTSNTRIFQLNLFPSKTRQKRESGIIQGVASSFLHKTMSLLWCR